MKRLPYLILPAFALVFSSSVVLAQHAGDDVKVEAIPITPTMESSAQKALLNCVPESKSVAEINKNGFYTLIGELLGNGHKYAFVDDNQDVLLCEWNKSEWKVISAINVSPVWNYPSGYRAPLEGRTPLDQPRPFWMLNLQSHPLLVIASQVERAGQYYYVVLFDAQGEHILDTASSFQSQPDVKDGYLILGDGSRGKAEWEARYYSQIRGNKLQVQKTWEDSQPWHAEDREGQPDDSSNYASSNGKGFLILPDNSGSKSPADYLILRCDSGQKRPDLYPPANEPFAAIYNSKKQANGISEPAILYLFNKLTRLPKELFPNYDSNLDKNAKDTSPSIFVIKGTDKNLVKMLTP